jgi:hypothetical protein
MWTNESPYFVWLHRLLCLCFDNSSPSDLKFSFKHNINCLWCLSLPIYYLVSFEFLEVKGIDQLLDLSFGLKFHKWKMAEEIYGPLDLLVLDALENALVVLTFDHRKLAGREALDGRRPRLVIDQCQLSEASSFSQSHYFYEPLQLLIAFYLQHLLALLRSQFDMRPHIKGELDSTLFELLFEP